MVEHSGILTQTQESTFNSMSQASLWAILEMYNVPDIDLFKLLYEHTTVRLPQSDMGSAKITFNTGVVQGSVLSPLLISLFINALSHYLDDIGTSKRISHGVQDILPFNHILFAGDMTLLAQNSMDMQCLMNAIQEFEAGSRILVNTDKTKLMIVDGIAANRADPVRVEYNNMDLVMERTLRAKETIQGHPLGPKQALEVLRRKR